MPPPSFPFSEMPCVSGGGSVWRLLALSPWRGVSVPFEAWWKRSGCRGLAYRSVATSAVARVTQDCTGPTKPHERPLIPPERCKVSGVFAFDFKRSSMLHAEREPRLRTSFLLPGSVHIFVDLIQSGFYHLIAQAEFLHAKRRTFLEEWSCQCCTRELLVYSCQKISGLS